MGLVEALGLKTDHPSGHWSSVIGSAAGDAMLESQQLGASAGTSAHLYTRGYVESMHKIVGNLSIYKRV